MNLHVFLRKLVRQDQPGLYRAALLWFLFSSVPLLIGFLGKLMFDALERRTVPSLALVGLAAAYFLSEAVHAALGWWWLHSHVTFKTRLEYFLRTRILEEVWPAPRYLHRLKSGDVLARLQDEPSPLLEAVELTYQTIGQLLFAAVAVFIMAKIDVWITFTIVIPTALVAFLIYRSSDRVAAARQRAHRASGDMGAFLTEAIAQIMTVKVLAAEPIFSKRFRHFADVRRQTAVYDVLLQRLIDVFGENLSTIARGVILLLAAAKIRNGTFTVGDFFLFAAYVEWLIYLPGSVGRWLASLPLAQVSLNRLHEIIPHQPLETLVIPKRRPERLHFARSGTTDPPLLELRNVSVTYSAGGGVRDVSFTAQPGSFTVVTGRTGAGKSSLLEALVGEAAIVSGDVLWNGCKVNDHAEWAIPPQIGFVSQVPVLFSGTLLENIMIADSEWSSALEQASQWVRAAVLEEDLGRMETGLDTMVGVRGAGLSGGQVSRVAIARMLAQRTQILVMDDAIGALDVETEEQLWTSLRALGKTVIVATHRQTALRMADQVVVLRDGKQVGLGTATHLWDDNPEFRRIWADASEDSTPTTVAD